MTEPDASPETPDSTPAPSGLLARVKAEFARREFLRHFTTLITGTAMAQVLQMVAMLLVARLFTKAEFGIYAGVMAVSSAILPLAALRYDMAIVLPARDNDARMLVKLSTRINTAIALVTTVVMVLFGRQIAPLAELEPNQVWYLWLVGPLTWLLAQVSILTYWLTRTKNYRTVSENKIVYATALSATQIGAGVVKGGAVGLMLATVIGQGLTLVNLLRRTRGQLGLDGGPHATMAELAREYRKMPLLNGPNALVDSVRLQGIPLLILSQFGKEASGVFGMAWRLLQAPIALINGAITQIFFQRLSVTKRGQMFALIRQTLLRSIAIGIVPFGLIWLLSPWLIPVVLGRDWAQAGEIARDLVPWLFVNFLTSPVSTVFVVARRQGLMLVFAIVFAAVPLAILWRSQADLLTTVTWVSWAMAAMLVVFALLALLVAHQFDRGIGGSDLDDVEDDLAAVST